MSADCIFCKIANKQIKTAIEYEDEWVVAFDDIHPQAPTHLLVIPRAHLTEAGATASKMAFAAKEVAKKRGISESGYRLVINSGKDAGQEVAHVHMHLLGGRKMGWPPG